MLQRIRAYFRDRRFEREREQSAEEVRRQVAMDLRNISLGQGVPLDKTRLQAAIERVAKQLRQQGETAEYRWLLNRLLQLQRQNSRFRRRITEFRNSTPDNPETLRRKG